MGSDASVAEDEYDEGETCGNEEGADVVYSFVDFCGWLIRVDRERASDHAENIEASREEKNGTPFGASRGDGLEEDTEA